MKQTLINKIDNILEKNQDFVMLTADLGFMAFEGLAKKYPDRFINVGISEVNMIEMAAGLTKEGYKVICYSMVPFIIHKCLETIKIHMETSSCPILLVGVGSGYTYGAQGSSHHTIEDVSIMSSFHNIQSFSPGSDGEMEYSLDQFIINNIPTYLRVGWPSSALRESYSVENLSWVISQKRTNLVISYGSSLGCAYKAISQEPNLNYDLLSVVKFSPLPLDDLIEVIEGYDQVYFFEPNIYQGGISQRIEARLFQIKSKVKFTAITYPKHYYKEAGSKMFLEDLAGQSPSKIRAELE